MKNVQQSKSPTKLNQHVQPSPKAKQAAEVASQTSSESAWHKQLEEDRGSKQKKDEPGSQPVGATSSANSITADPFSRNKSLGEPVPQVTRHI